MTSPRIICVGHRVVDAWFGGCLPLYNGDPMLARDFNPAALLNYQDYLDVDRFVEQVRRLDADRGAYDSVYSQPVLSQRSSLGPLIAFLRSAVAQIRGS